MNEVEFQELIWQKGRELHREMPWRADTNPYFVLVSELMLQQTQVDRVVPKFNEFIQTFPDIKTLSRAPLAQVLVAWSGLGYNRRAKFLHSSAKQIVEHFGGNIPDNYDELVSLPGIGPNTAGAILAYAFNRPVVFIETNIRTIYFHHFFTDRNDITDSELRTIVELTLDTEHPREWYQALMDYGAHLKKSGSGRLDQSRHYKKQAPLRGSVREVRGQIIKVLAAGDMPEHDLRQRVNADEKFDEALKGLRKDGLVQQTGGDLHLTK